jgi:protein SCO1/2
MTAIASLRRGPSPRALLITAAALCWGLVFAAALVIVQIARPGLVRQDVAAHLDDFGPLPVFGLTDQLGRPVRSDELRGKVLLADFIYTNCGDACPLLTARMQTLQERLRSDRLLGTQVQLLSFTTDPARDTVAVLRAYAEQHQADPDAWRFLTGPEQYLIPLVQQGFHIADQPVPPAADATTYDVMHGNRVILVDRTAHVRAYYDGLAVDPDQIVTDVRRLLR